MDTESIKGGQTMSDANSRGCGSQCTAWTLALIHIYVYSSMSNAQLSQVLYVLVHTVTYINIFDTDTCTLYNTVVRLDHTYQYEYSEGKSRNPPVYTEFSKKNMRIK